MEVTMELWTDYEGRTIDGVYPLTKLIRPEGRSAFFSTSNGTGVPTVIRLIESHFDDEEILTRWRGVMAMDHANLVKLKKYGQVMLDETSLVYAVMEPVESNLAEILSQRRLTVIETRQVAASLLAALQALHDHGFVHEHVEPANVLAVGETIKLRSDCIREVSEGREGTEQKARDVHDLSVVLLQSLTEQKTLQAAARDLPLAAPFDEIVRKGISGEWGLAQIAKTLGPVASPAAAEKTAPRAPEPSPATYSSTGSDYPASRTSPAAAAAAISASSPSMSSPTSSPTSSQGMAGSSRATDSPSRSVVTERRLHTPIEDEPAGLGRGAGLRAVIGLMAVVVLFLAWRFLHNRPTAAGTSSAPISTPAPILDNGVTKSTPAPTPVEIAPRPVAPAHDVAAPGTGQWRVVAFTYNHEDQARQKADALTKAHPNLQMGVFTPNGRPPYLVTVGGPMSREQAFALAGKAKRAGLPRDTYAQNYRGR